MKNIYNIINYIKYNNNNYNSYFVQKLEGEDEKEKVSSLKTKRNIEIH